MIWLTEAWKFVSCNVPPDEDEKAVADNYLDKISECPSEEESDIQDEHQITVTVGVDKKIVVKPPDPRIQSRPIRDAIRNAEKIIEQISSMSVIEMNPITKPEVDRFSRREPMQSPTKSPLTSERPMIIHPGKRAFTETQKSKSKSRHHNGKHGKILFSNQYI